MSLSTPLAEPEASPRSPWLGVACLLASAVCLGMALNERDGEYYPKSLALLTASLVLCAAGALGPRWPDAAPTGRAALRLVAVAAVVAQALVVLRSPPSGWFFWSDDIHVDAWATPHLFYGIVGIAYGLAAVLAVAQYAGSIRVGRAAVPVVLLLHVAAGVWMIRSSPQPRIDVHLFQQEAARVLLDGRNPYAITFDDMYRSTAPGGRPVYGQGLVRDGKLVFGFPYPPLSLYLSTLGYAATGDHRYTQLAAITLAGALLAYARPGPWASLMAVLFLFAPRTFFVLGRGWTEPFVVLFLAATVFCACRCGRLLPVALGLLFASKQYLVLAAPLVWLLVEGPSRGRAYAALMLKAGGVAAVVTLPFAAWDWPAFWHSLVTVQKVAPFREDALSYLVWVYHRTGVRLGVAPAFVAAGIALVLVLWRAGRNPAGFAAGVALVYLVFISSNKQAFANYYYFALGALYASVAASRRTHHPPGPPGVAYPLGAPIHRNDA